MAIIPTSSRAENIQPYMIAGLTRGAVDIVERSHLKRLLAEQDLQLTDLIDPDTAVRAGRLAGAQAVLFHDVGEVRYEFHRLGGGLYGMLSGDFRLVDVARGDVVLAGSATVKRNFTPEFGLVFFALPSTTERQMERLIDDVADRGADRAAAELPKLYGRRVCSRIVHEIRRARKALSKPNQ